MGKTVTQKQHVPNPLKVKDIQVPDKVSSHHPEGCLYQQLLETPAPPVPLNLFQYCPATTHCHSHCPSRILRKLEEVLTEPLSWNHKVTEWFGLEGGGGDKSKLRPRSWANLHGVQKHHENSKHQPAALQNTSISPEAGPLKPLMLKTLVVPLISCLQVEQSDFGSVCSKST